MRFVIIMLLLAVGFGIPAAAAVGPDCRSITVDTSRSFILVQDHTATTVSKELYVLSEDDDVEVVAWRWIVDEWIRVIPNPAMSPTYSDSVAICPAGYTLPVIGQFDALTIRGVNTGGDVQIQWYK